MNTIKFPFSFYGRPIRRDTAETNESVVSRKGNGIKYSIIQRHPPTRMRFYFLLPLQKVPLKINYYEYFEKNRSVYLAPLF